MIYVILNNKRIYALPVAQSVHWILFHWMLRRLHVNWNELILFGSDCRDRCARTVSHTAEKTFRTAFSLGPAGALVCALPSASEMTFPLFRETNERNQMINKQFVILSISAFALFLQHRRFQTNFACGESERVCRLEFASFNSSVCVCRPFGVSARSCPLALTVLYHHYNRFARSVLWYTFSAVPLRASHESNGLTARDLPLATWATHTHTHFQECR